MEGSFHSPLPGDMSLRETFSEPIECGPRQPFPHISLLYSSPKSVALWLSAGDVEPDCQS